MERSRTLWSFHGWYVSSCGTSSSLSSNASERVGVIAQQLLVLPYLLANSNPLSFRTTHLFLIATRCKVVQGHGLPVTAVPGKPRSLEERREGAKRVIAATLDPAWIKDNGSRFDEILARVVSNNLRCVNSCMDSMCWTIHRLLIAIGPLRWLVSLSPQSLPWID